MRGSRLRQRALARFRSGLGLLALAGPPTVLQEGPTAPAAPAVLSQRPEDLPRASPGRWADYDGAEGLAVEPADLEKLRRARDLYLAGDYPRALAEAFELLERVPDFPEALALAGLVDFRLRRWGDAARFYERMIEVAPKLLGRSLALGHAYYSLGAYAAAEAHYRRLLEVRPGEPGALRGLALVHWQRGEGARARALLEGLLGRGEDPFECHLWLARILLDAGDLEAAGGHLERLVEMAPRDPRVWFVRLTWLQELGREEEARAAEARWRELDREAQALAALEARLALAPRRFDLLSGVAELRARLGRREGFQALLGRLREARPAEVEPVELDLWILERARQLGDGRWLVEWGRELEGRYPDDPRVFERLATVYGQVRARSDQVRARRQLEKLR